MLTVLQCINTISVISKQNVFSPFSSLAISLLVLPSNFANHFANLDVNSVLDNRKFWQNVKPLFSNKVKAKTTIKLIKNGETIDNETKIAKIFNEYFVNTVKI